MENKQFYRKINKKIPDAVGEPENLVMTKSEVIEVTYLNGVYSICSISNYNKGESLAMLISHNVEKEFINDLIQITEESNLSEWFAALSIYEASVIKAADISTQLTLNSYSLLTSKK